MAEAATRTIGKYRLYGKIGSGGMGSVHLGRVFALGGFRRIVAIKRLHPHFAADDAFVTAFLEEARLASRIHHPNVVAPLDVVAQDGEVFLVFEHLLGVSLAVLMRRAAERGEPMPPRIVTSIMVNVLHGLHAAHEAKSDNGDALGLVHRDVSPQNVLVGSDGTSRLLDFGIAKATGRSQTTDEGVVKGKRGYMAPEHMLGATYQASDLYSAAVVLWELVAGRRLFPDETSTARRLAGEPIPPPAPVAPASGAVPSVERELLDAVAVRGLAHAIDQRFRSAREMAIALEAVGVATAREVGEWVARVAHAELAERARLVELIESAAGTPTAAGSTSAPASLGDEATSTEVATPAAPADAEVAGVAPRRRRHALLGLAGALLVLVASGSVVALALARRTPTAAAPLEPASTSPARSDSEAARPGPSAEASREAARTGEPKAEEAVPVSPKPHTLTGSRPPKKRTDAPCKPYVIDKSGRTLFNEDCLR